MQPQLDANRHIIEPLLSRLKELNSSIGGYEKSIQNEDFSYVVKLSNGKIILSNEIVDDFGLNPAFVTEEQLKWAAQSFVPSTVTTAMPKPVIQPSPSYPSQTLKEQPTKEVKDSSPTRQQPNYTPVQKKKDFLLGAFICIGVAAIIIFIGVTVYNNNKKAGIRDNIRSYVTARGSTYTYRLIGGISNFSISVTNSTEYVLDDVRIKVRYIKADGEIWKNEFLDFSYLSPYGTMTIKAPDSDRGIRVNYEIVSIRSSALDLR